jgi:hypothetical protein
MEVSVTPMTSSQIPGSYILCREHADKLTPPQGWTLMVTTNESPPGGETDIAQLAREVRRVGLGLDTEGEGDGTEHTLSNRPDLVMLTSRAHLRVVADSGSVAGEG